MATAEPVAVAAATTAPLTPQAAPARIVSTSPSITETLFALGLGDRVVGVSRFCRFPAEAAARPKIGTFLRPDAELIAQLRPDLVIVHAGPSGIEQRLTTLRIRFVVVERGTLDSVFSTIKAIGAAAGVPERAAALVAQLNARLDRVRQAVASRRRQKVLLIVGRRAGTLSDLIAVGRGSYLSDVVTIAGGVNVLSDPGLPEYPRISMETVIRYAPDVIIDAGDMGDTAEERERRRAVTESLWARQSLPSLRTGRVHAAVSDAFVLPGPRVVEVAEQFARWLHGATPPAVEPREGAALADACTVRTGRSRGAVRAGVGRGGPISGVPAIGDMSR